MAPFLFPVNTLAWKQGTGPLAELAQVDPGFNSGCHLAKRDNFENGRERHAPGDDSLPVFPWG
jgi:hypothetical protein